MPSTNLIDSLQNLRRRMKVFGVMYGAGIVVACAVGLLLAMVLLDWALALPTPLRLVVNLAALGAMGYALYHWVAREAMKKLPLTDLAGRLEHRYPEFEDTLRSTVDFVRPTRGVIPGSEMMKQRTIAEAGRRAGQVNLNSAVVLKPVWYSAGAGLGALLLVGSLVLLADKKFPEFLRIATNHLLGGAEPWPKSVEIEMTGPPIPKRVAVGQHIDVRMRLKKGGNKQAVVKYRFDNGPWQNEVMDRADDGTYDAGLDARIDAKGAGEEGCIGPLKTGGQSLFRRVSCSTTCGPLAASRSGDLDEVRNRQAQHGRMPPPFHRSIIGETVADAAQKPDTRGTGRSSRPAPAKHQEQIIAVMKPAWNRADRRPRRPCSRRSPWRRTPTSAE